MAAAEVVVALAGRRRPRLTRHTTTLIHMMPLRPLLNSREGAPHGRRPEDGSAVGLSCSATLGGRSFWYSVEGVEVAVRPPAGQTVLGPQERGRGACFIFRYRSKVWHSAGVEALTDRHSAKERHGAVPSVRRPRDQYQVLPELRCGARPAGELQRSPCQRSGERTGCSSPGRGNLGSRAAVRATGV